MDRQQCHTQAWWYMCGIIWWIISIMLYIYSGWVLQLGIILLLCSTLCGETQGKMILWQIFQGLHIPLSTRCLRLCETRLNELRSSLPLSNAALLQQCSWQHQDWLSVNASLQDNIPVALCDWLMVSELDEEDWCAT